MTRKGERIFQPNFGSGIHELLFEQVTDDLEGRLQENITDSVNFWLPYINIDTIEVNMTDEMKDRYTAEMKIQFTVGNVYEPQEITFLVEGKIRYEVLNSIKRKPNQGRDIKIS